MKWNQVINIDAMKGVRGLPDESVRTVVTSPPYFRQRDYGCAGQWEVKELEGILTRNNYPSGRRFESHLGVFIFRKWWLSLRLAGVATAVCSWEMW